MHYRQCGDEVALGLATLDAIELMQPGALAYVICGLYNFLQRYDGAALVRRKLWVL